MQSIKVHSVTGDVRPVNAISVWDASSTGKRPVDSIPVWDDTNDGDKPLNAIQVKLVGDEPSAIKVWFKDSEGPGPGPSLPPYTIRLKFTQGTTPTFNKGTGTLVDEENNIWDLTYENSSWSGLLSNKKTLLEVLVANTTGVTDMQYMFNGCNKLTTVALFDTSSVTNMTSMFMGCSLLSSIPLFDTSSVTDMNTVFYSCYNVQSGAFALYQQASKQTNPPAFHKNTFKNCGSNTPTGLADLAFIPTSWGGNFTGFNEVTIGNVTWADSNVAIDDGEGGIVTQELHDVNGVDLGTQYYYSSGAAQRIANKIVGWKLPSNREIASLYMPGDRQALMSNSAWTYHNGNNHTGLNMKPVGYCNPTLENTGTYSPFWQDNGVAYSIVDSTWSTELVSIPSFSYIPIRLVKEQNS